MNFFSSEDFLEPLAVAFFPGQARSIETFEVAGQAFRLLVVGRGRVISDWPFLDFVEPLESVPRAARRLGYLRRALRGVRPVSQWTPEPPEADCEPCPYVDWSLFPTWEDYFTHLGRPPKDWRRRVRTLERDLGPVSLTFEDRDPAAFAVCLRWKSEQYRESGYRDHFADRRFVAFFEAMNARGALVVSTLRAGERLLAVHIAARHEGRFYSWIPAFDRGLARYSPGRILLEHLLEQSHAARHRQFDFLIGGEAYKFQYATHVRIAGPLGAAPLALRAEREARRRARNVLAQWPWLDERVRHARKTLREIGLR